MSAKEGIIFFDLSSFKMDEEIPFYCKGALINVHLQLQGVHSNSELHIQHCSHQPKTSKRYLSSRAAMSLSVIFPCFTLCPSFLILSRRKQDLFSSSCLLLHNPLQHTAGSCRDNYVTRKVLAAGSTQWQERMNLKRLAYFHEESFAKEKC